jgi:tetratricopeptide (TPR) repeat protein
VISGVLQPVVARSAALLERGQAGGAADTLAPLLRSRALPREDELAIRSLLAEAFVILGELAQATTALGRSPDTIRENLPPVLLSTLWRLHGRIAFARGEQSRAIALHGRALKQAEMAHDSRSIGLAHYELGLCYMKVGDMAIVREHIAEAAAALHAAGDRRHLALVHSLSGIVLAQNG